MEPNNFEKNVQQKMDELKIAPSESVWTSVEKRIRKKEKDKRFVFILFFLLLLLLSGGYWLLNSTKNNERNKQQISNVIKKDSVSKARLKDSFGQATNNEDSSFEKNKMKTKTKSENTYKQSLSDRKLNYDQFKIQNKAQELNQNNPKDFMTRDAIQKNEKNSKQTNSEVFDFTINKDLPLPEIITEITPIETESFTHFWINPVQISVLREGLLVHFQMEKSMDESIVKKHPQKKRWSLGITFSGGASLIGNNIFDRNYPTANMFVSFPQRGIPYYYSRASHIKSSAAFIAGVFVEKNISSKTKISLGLSYKYYSLLNKVGNKIDSPTLLSQYLASSNNYFNSANSLHSYRNDFHFLEIPVAFYLQLNENKKLPLLWHVGVNVSQLVSTNALQFKSSPGVYYNNNSLFRKTQLGLSTGFSVTLFSQQTLPFSFGPYFYYSPTSIAGQGLYANKHFSFIGIRTEILFHKK